MRIPHRPAESRRSAQALLAHLCAPALSAPALASTCADRLGHCNAPGLPRVSGSPGALAWQRSGDLDEALPLADDVPDLAQPGLITGYVKLVESDQPSKVAGQDIRLADQIPVELQQIIEADPPYPVPDQVLIEHRQALDHSRGVVDLADQPLSPAHRLHHLGGRKRLVPS